MSDAHSSRDSRLRPWLWLPPKLAHDMSSGLLKLYTFFNDFSPASFAWAPLDWQGLHFRNPVGIAGGVDKDGDNLLDWQTVGAGFLELGTVTPLPQRPNSGRIMARDVAKENIWNRMGFPSAGSREAVARIEQLENELQVPVFVNIGKNRETSNERAHEDYSSLLRQFAGTADAFVVNISSPNTEGLRDLFQPQYLQKFLAKLCKQSEALTSAPLLLKLSPDLANDELQMALRTALDVGFKGFVLTNTTISRQNAPTFPSTGGASGRLLAARSKECLGLSREIIEKYGRTDCLLVSVGGIFKYGDVMERLKLGAHLTQVYSSLIFSGPGLFTEFAKEAGQRQTEANTETTKEERAGRAGASTGTSRTSRA